MAETRQYRVEDFRFKKLNRIERKPDLIGVHKPSVGDRLVVERKRQNSRNPRSRGKERFVLTVDESIM